MPDEPIDQPTTPEDLGRTFAAMLGDVVPPPAPREEDPAPPPALRIIEALLFVGGAPLTAKRARAILRGLTQEQFDNAVAQLNADYRRQARPDRKSTRLNSSHIQKSRMPSSA